MTIDELNALTTLTAADEVPVWDSEESGEPTKKITASNLAASVKSLGNLIGTGDLDSTPMQGSNKAVTSGGVYNAIAQSTATLKGEDIQLASSSVLIPNNTTTKVFNAKSFNEYKFVDLYFAFQGGYIPAMRLVTNYQERKFKVGFFAFNEGDGVLRRCVLTFTSSGRYMDNVVVKVAAGDNGAFSDNTTSLYLVAAVGYKW
jgi:hypothetical protein